MLGLIKKFAKFEKKKLYLIHLGIFNIAKNVWLHIIVTDRICC